MSKHPARASTTDDVSMWDNPNESPLVRQLLRAGRVDQVDYDVEAGLARHLANMQSGTSVPPWAVAQSTVQKGWNPALLAWLLPPVISATFVGAWLYLRPADTSPTALALPSAAPAALPSSVVAAAPSLPPAAGPSVQQPSTAVARPAPDAVELSGGRERERETDVAADAQARLRPSNAVRVGRHAVVPHRTRAAHVPNVASDGPSAVAHAVASTSPNAAAPSVAATSTTETHNDNAAAAPAHAPAAQTQTAQTAQTVNDRREAEQQPQREHGVSDSRLEREMQMLAVAQRVLSSDPERSLRLTRQGEQEFRGSMFSAERTQVSLLALVQLGRVDEARRLGTPFLRAYPNAPWSARLREALATGRLPAGAGR